MRFSLSARWGRTLGALLLALLASTALALSTASTPAAANENDREQMAEMLIQIQRQLGVAVEMTGTSIPPVVIHEGHGVDHTSQPPIDIAQIEITTLTPADKFSYAITPLIVVLALGSIMLVGIGLSQKVADDAV